MVASWILVTAPRAVADQHVAVSSSANADYTRRKYGDGKSQPETYVFMAGKYFEGITVDRSIDKMPFRRIAEMLAPELARQHYFPTKTLETADLLLVVYWGTTIPRNESNRMEGITTFSSENTMERAEQAALNASRGDDPVYSMFVIPSDEGARKLEFGLTEREGVDVEGELQSGNNAQLLGYTQQLRRLQTSALSSTTEATLRGDLASERYFIIIKAYDLHDKVEPGHKRRSVWTLHLNTRSPGNNFPAALKKMGAVAVDYFGRNSDGVETAHPVIRTGTVTLAPIVILGTVKPEDVQRKDNDSAQSGK